MLIFWLPWILVFLAPFALLFSAMTGIPFIIWYILFIGTGVYIGIMKRKQLKDKGTKE
jgi:hypothetical protein